MIVSPSVLRLIVQATVIMWVLTACNLTGATPPVTPTDSVSIAPNIRIAQQTTPIPTEDRTARTIPTTTPVPVTTASPIVSDCVRPENTRAQHKIIANLNYGAREVAVAQQILYNNTTGTILESLVLNIEPNNIAGAFVLEMVQIEGADVDYTLERNQLTVTLPQVLEPDCSISLNLTFEVRPPQIGSGIAAFRGYFGHSPRQMNLAHWLPVVAPYRGQWLINEPSSIGENIVLEQADWEIRFNLVNAPENLKLAAPGTAQQIQPDQWQYRLEGARDFPVSISEFFNIARTVSDSGVAIEVYTFPDAILQTDTGILDGPNHVLQEAVRSFSQFESLFGDYPYERFLVVQGDFPDGMEFSGLVFVSTSWFYSFPGGASNYLTVITVHEVSHQWWYTRVGNDSALTPWLDEALATYSEYIYFEEYHPDLKNWWWTFRVANYYPQGNVDSSVYEFASIRDYINAVYLRGVQMLHNLREDIGTDAFFDLLNRYATTADGDIGTSELFWSLLSKEQYELSQQTRSEFLRAPDILPIELLDD